jgi:hypothetical protein
MRIAPMLLLRILPALALLTAPGGMIRHAEDDATERLLRALPYLSSTVPEQQRRAEALIQAHATERFEILENALPGLDSVARQRLLAILVRSDHDRRTALCVRVLTNADASRAERSVTWRALRSLPRDALLEKFEARLAEPEPEPFERAQLIAMLGVIPSARAQSVGETIMAGLEHDSLQRFLAEDAVLRSALDSSFAQPAWARYQERHAAAPRVTLRELQGALDELARPSATERARAEEHLTAMIGRDVRLLLALARSPWPERAGYALTRLKAEPPQQLALPALAVLLDAVTTATEPVALLAVDAAVAMRPPTAEEMAELRTVSTSRAMTSLQAIVESLARLGDLAELRAHNQRLTARLRPLLLRRGPMDAEVRQKSDELQRVRARLEALEDEWREGWRRVFEADILEPGSN